MPDAPLRSTRILKNFGLLLSGRIGAALMTVLALSIMARELGVASFGLVILVHTFILIMNGFCSTKAFEAIVRFGLQAKLRDDQSALLNLISCSLLADLLFALISCALAIALAPVIGSWLMADEQFSSWVSVYALVLLFTGTSTAKGVLRLYDRFATLGIQLAMGPLVRLLLVLVSWQAGLQEPGFLVAWAGGFLVENLILHWQCRKQLRQEGLHPQLRQVNFRVLASDNNGFWPFVGVTYVQGTLDLLPKQIATLLSGLFLGTSAAGLFRVAREIATVVSRPALLLREATFTDLSHLWETRDPTFMRVTRKAAMLSGLIGSVLLLLMWPFGDAVLRLLFGLEYISAHTLLLVLLGAATLELSTSSLHMAAYAMGKATKVVIINVIATLLYLGCFAGLTPQYGLIATGWAAVSMALFSFLGVGLLVQQGKR